MGVSVLPPDINESRMSFTVSGGNIRFGLLALRSVGHQFVRAILDERRRAPFSSFEDFVERMAAIDLNKRMVESLIKSGAFDRLSVYRSRLLHSYERLIELVQDKNRGGVKGQLDMFSMLMETPDTSLSSGGFSYPELPEFSMKEKLRLEKESSGMYFSGHLLDSYGKHIAALKVDEIGKFVKESVDFPDKLAVRVAGAVTSITKKKTKKDQEMAFFMLEDRFHSIECLLFPRQYEALGRFVTGDAPLCVEGNLSLGEGEGVKILVSRIIPLIEDEKLDENAIKKASADLKGTDRESSERRENSTARKAVGSVQSEKSPSKVYLRFDSLTSETYRKVAKLLDAFGNGDFHVIVYDSNTKAYTPYPHGVMMNDYVRRELEQILGKENVVFR